MSNQLELDEYKQHLADRYSHRSRNYDESKWHSQITHCLVNHAQISPGQNILDIATGTGHVAIEVAQIVGDSGRVVGVDIAPGMLDQARHKVEELKLSNIEFQLADAEALNFSANSFDRVLCANAFPMLADKEATLRLWHRFLKPDGLVGIHAPSKTAFRQLVILKQEFKKYGVLPALFKLGETVDTVEKCWNLLEKTGFEAIEIKSEQHGSYISLEQAKQGWNLVTELVAPQPFSNSLAQLSSEELEQIRSQFEAQLEALATEQGIWNNGTHLFAFGCKQSK